MVKKILQQTLKKKKKKREKNTLKESNRFHEIEAERSRTNTDQRCTCTSCRCCCGSVLPKEPGREAAGDEVAAGALERMDTAGHTETCTWKFTHSNFHFLFHHDRVWKSGPDDQRPELMSVVVSKLRLLSGDLGGRRFQVRANSISIKASDHYYHVYV